MSFSQIDPTTPAGTDKKKFGDDIIRELKQQIIDNLKEITNYPASAKPALKTAVWTTATRPSGSELIGGVMGLNSDHGCVEYYDVSDGKWKYHSGIGRWSVATRPSTPPVGLIGYCTDLNVIERYTGSAWERLSGGRRGDIKMWSGSVSDIEPGWCLCDGVTRTHPEGGTFTPPNLRDRFIVGAGASYAVGATGGEAFHTLTINEMPSHTHNYVDAYRSRDSYDTRDDEGGNDLGIYYVTRTTTATGGNQPHENRPPYYALCFLYKL